MARSGSELEEQETTSLAETEAPHGNVGQDSGAAQTKTQDRTTKEPGLDSEAAGGLQEEPSEVVYRRVQPPESKRPKLAQTSRIWSASMRPGSGCCWNYAWP
jgi:hypothetical protein